MNYPHSFYIPVMGIGFTLDSPLKLAPFGIDSVMSLSDDMLIEKLRKFYSKKFNKPFQAVEDNHDDPRAKRITLYLDLIHDLVNEKIQAFHQFNEETKTEVFKYFELLPSYSELKKKFSDLDLMKISKEEISLWLKEHLKSGSIDVNVMTKLDKINYKKNKALPDEFNDAHAAVRGFAKSKVQSNLILSAGMNPKLFGYMAELDEFFPDAEGNFKKKIVLKVSDYRSALIQGKFLAKKGLWVSEYRIESGLNCGGHAFATDGYLIGPILEEFKNNRMSLSEEIRKVFEKGLEEAGRTIPLNKLDFKITAQGGVGTNEEHDFLRNNYNIDAVGWGTPFLLCPEASTVDDETLEKLAQAKEEDLYTSDISPLGVPFNNLKGNTKDVEKADRIAAGRPGSPCPKKYLVSNTEFTEKAICTASRQYQSKKLAAIVSAEKNEAEITSEYAKITEKSCICVGLGTSSLLKYDLDYKVEGPGVSVCPGPNMAYYDHIVSLKEMVGHVYGRNNVMNFPHRPHMFIKELQCYIKHLHKEIIKKGKEISKKDLRYFDKYMKNLHSGISYYENLFQTVNQYFSNVKNQSLEQLKEYKEQLQQIELELSEKEVS
ncbi:Uncharacterised protein [Candidatus Ornithobacterium hominis]|uniref:hypothetical protein n=1 Tax=Candidatus Ornithobacterium hominis TaxID=2497989 RepID=UPI000E5A6539|nr:hypothetical protein [Candidatus Ornithobacterium hominis]SZD73175.1 Uncharacterised protein [Candidatus Ornithobacterium hominis]